MEAVALADLVRHNIKRIREDRDWSQAHLATLMRANGLTRWTANTVVKVEGGKIRADRLADLATLCASFDIALPELLAGDGDVIMDYPGNTKPLLDVRMALVGMAPPTDPTLAIVDEYSIDRIVALCKLSSYGELRACMVVKYGRLSFLEVRDQRAGILIRPGDRKNIAARRGNATKVMVREIRDMLNEHELQWVLDRAMEIQRTWATDDVGDGEDAT